VRNTYGALVDEMLIQKAAILQESFVTKLANDPIMVEKIQKLEDFK
jgi:hypothetical protein